MNLRRLAASDVGALTELSRVCEETYLSWARREWHPWAGLEMVGYARAL